MYMVMVEEKTGVMGRDAAATSEEKAPKDADRPFAFKKGKW